MFGTSLSTLPAIAKQKHKKNAPTQSSIAADRMVADINPKLSTYKKEPISVIDGKLQSQKQGDSVKLAAAVLRLQPVDAEAPVARLKVTGTLPFSKSSDLEKRPT